MPKECKSCVRNKNYSAMVKSNVCKERPDKICMGCFKAGKHNGCEKKKIGNYNSAPNPDIKY